MDTKRIFFEIAKDKWKDFKKVFKDLSKFSRMLVCLIAINIVFIFINTLASLIFRIKYFEDDVVWTSIVAEVAVTLLTVFCCYLGIDAIFLENEFQYFGYVLNNLILTFFMICLQAFRIVASVIEIINDSSNGQIFTYELYGLIAGCIIFIIPFSIQIITLLTSIFLLRPILQSFGWKIFRSCGANIQLRKCYRVYLIYITMLKSDFAINVTAVFIVLGIIERMAIQSYIFNFYALFFCTILTPLSVYFATKREQYILQIGYIVLSLVYPLYILYYLIHSIVSIYAINVSEADFGFLIKIDDNFYIVLILFAGVLVIGTRLVTAGLAIAVTINFRKGLREIFEKRNMQQTEHSDMNTIEQILRDVSDE